MEIIAIVLAMAAILAAISGLAYVGLQEFYKIQAARKLTQERQAADTQLTSYERQLRSLEMKSRQSGLTRHENLEYARLIQRRNDLKKQLYPGQPVFA